MPRRTKNDAIRKLFRASNKLWGTGTAATESPEAPFRAAGGEVLAALIFTGALFLGLVLVNPDWPYAPVGWVDMHVSRFFADAPILLRRSFSDSPSGDLFSIYLPIAIFGRILGYFWGNLIWKGLAFACTGTAFFVAVRRFATRWAAAYGTLLFVSYQYFLIALSGDYTDSRVVLYFSMALGLGLYSGGAATVVASGFFFGLCAIASLQTVFLVPAFAILCFSSFWEDAETQDKWPAVTKKLLLLGGGFALCIAAASIYNQVFFGKLYFFEKSVDKARSFLGTDRRSVKDWAFIRRWTVIPFLAAAMSLLAGIKELAWFKASTPAAGPAPKTPRPREASSQEPARVDASLGAVSCVRLGIFASVVLTVAIYLYLFFVKRQESLSNPWYLANIQPVMFLGLVAALQGHIEASGKKARWIAMATLTAMLFAIMHLYHIGDMPRFAQKWFSGDTLIVFLMLGLLAYCLVVGKSYFIPATLLFVVLNLFSASLVAPSIFDTRGRAELRAVEEDWISWVREVDPQRRALLWYHGAETPFCASLATSSHAWVSRLVNDTFPDTEHPVNSAGDRPVQLPTKGDVVIVMSARNDAVDLAISALKLKNIHAVAGEHREFVSARFPFVATLLRCD